MYKISNSINQSASKMTCVVLGGALNSIHLLTAAIVMQVARWQQRSL